MWVDRPGRWGGRADLRDAEYMEWRVGVLRPRSENVDWTDGGDAPSWTTARVHAIAALRVLVAAEGVRQEYRMRVDNVPVLLWPGLDADGCLDVSGLDIALPFDRDRPWST